MMNRCTVNLTTTRQGHSETIWRHDHNSVSKIMFFWGYVRYLKNSPSSEVNLRRGIPILFYLFTVIFEYLSRLGNYTLLTGKFTVVAKDRSAFILRVKPASQPNLVRISRRLKWRQYLADQKSKRRNVPGDLNNQQHVYGNLIIS